MKKVILVCIVILIVLGGVGGVMVLQSFVSITEDGVEYAQNNDQEACLHESLQRLSWCSGLRCEVKTVAFAHICFQGAQVNEALCETVPSSVLQIQGWAASACVDKDLPAQACERIHVQAAKACFVNRFAGNPKTEETSNINHQSKNKLPATADYLGVITQIQGRVTQVNFFESGDDVPERENRRYARQFASAQSRYINWELEFEFPELHSATRFEIKAVYYWPDGTLMGEPLHTASLKQGWTYSWQSYGWGWPEPGEWPEGLYKAEFFVGDEKIAASQFTMH